jgi:DNA-binding response OmpR family regulator
VLVLSIAKAIIEKHGGQIGFETELDRGTTFFFDLPVVHTTKHAEHAVVPSSQQAHILVCEDDHDIATLLTLILQHAGFHVDVAHTAAHAKQLLAHNQYGGMTLDLALPDEDGVALIRELRAQDTTRELPIVIVSAYTQQGRIELNGDAVGIIDWLDKPIDTARLLQAVQRAVTHGADARLHILHVEDDADVRAITAAVVQEIAVVTAVESIAEAKAQLAQAAFDLVLLDISLPDRSGLELLPVIANCTTPPTPVLIFSAQDLPLAAAVQGPAALIKSRTSNKQFVDTILSVIQRQPKLAAAAHPTPGDA